MNQKNGRNLNEAKSKLLPVKKILAGQSIDKFYQKIIAFLK
jgi:hypothetical protein